MFADIPYAVLGLGDTNYDQYCHMGKMIDKRLKELGGNRLHPLCCADEATGLEDTVEGWKTEIMALLGKLDQLLADSSKESNKIATPSTVPIAVPTAAAGTGIPSGLLKMGAVTEWLQLADQTATAPEATQLPNCKKVLSQGPLIKTSAPLATECIVTKPVDGWTADRPFLAQISEARWLTAAENLSESGIEYLPGDSVGICCPNPSFLVESVFLRLKETHTEADFSLDSSITVTTNGEDVTSSLREILTYK
jgi:methionine synthase reductase